MDASEATAAFLMRMRARGIRDLNVLRVLERVPRQAFVPHRYADLATRDIALPIGCGQTMPEPFVLARMLEGLALRPQHRVLEIGAGSGYVTAAMARLAGEVIALERFQTLAIEAKTRLEEQEVGNADVVWADGLLLPPDIGLFDRIFAEAEVTEIPVDWLRVLAPEGALVLATPRALTGSASGLARQHLVVIARDVHGRFSETAIVPSRLQPLLPGRSRGL